MEHLCNLQEEPNTQVYSGFDMIHPSVFETFIYDPLTFIYRSVIRPIYHPPLMYMGIWYDPNSYIHTYMQNGALVWLMNLYIWGFDKTHPNIYIWSFNKTHTPVYMHICYMVYWYNSCTIIYGALIWHILMYLWDLHDPYFLRSYDRAHTPIHIHIWPMVLN